MQPDAQPQTCSRRGEKPDQKHAPLTQDQAKELFRSVDEILSFASKDTKLPIQHTVKRQLITRDEVKQVSAGEVRRG